jgi:hypothetical protein
MREGGSMNTVGKITANEGGFLINNSGKTMAASCYSDISDARRLAACWNAFDGIPIEKFEGKDVADFIGSQAFLNGMSSTDGSAYIGLNGKACQVLASAFAGQFIGAGAVNFLEVNMEHPEIGSFTVTMQKTSGLTPAQLKAQAEKERDEALAALEELLRHFTKTPSTLADSEARGKAHAVIAKLKGGAV